MMNRSLPININEDLKEDVRYRSVLFSIMPYVIEYNYERHDMMPMHWHEDYQLSWVYDGELEFLIDGERLQMDKWEMIFINQNKFHSSRAVNQDALTLCINFSLAHVHPKIVRDYLEPILSKKDFMYFKLPVTASIKYYLERILSDIPSSNLPVKETAATDYFYPVSLINHVLEKIVVQNEESSHEEYNNIDFEFLNKLLVYIHNNYQNKITIDDLIEEVHISKSMCNALFKKYTKESPINYLTKYRLQRAQDLIINTDKSITEISGECGFGSVAYFVERFRLSYNLTPLKFRKKFKV